ncbi:MAG: hypothetical protein DRO12_01945, partial [Thermoprotei archaeon]
MNLPLIDIALGMELYATPTPPVPSARICGEESFQVYEVHGDFIVRPPYRALTSHRCQWFVYAIVKRGLSTFEAVSILSRALRCRYAKFSGLKEAWGTTHQLVFLSNCERYSAYLRLGEKLEAIFLGCVERTRTNTGNLFMIKLVVEPEDLPRLRQAVEAINTTEIPNYYGYQRFGYVRPITHLVGKMLLERLWDEAIMCMIGKPFPQESPRSVTARKVAEGGDYCHAYQLFREAGLEIEARISNNLCRGASPLETLRKLPRELLHLYVNAYQSYLFNKILSSLFSSKKSISQVIPVPG